MNTDIKLSLTDLITHLKGYGVAVDIDQRSDVIKLFLNGGEIFQTSGNVGYTLTQSFLYGMLAAAMIANQEDYFLNM